jgi:hypothetical protein
MRNLLALALLGAASIAAGPVALSQSAPQATPPAAAAPQPTVSFDHATLSAMVPVPRPEDVSSPENLISATYAVISGPPGPRDWDRFRSLFVPQARLTAAHKRKDGTGAITLLGVMDYVNLAGAGFLKSGFFENSMHNETRRFGNIAQVFSSYESRHAINEAPFARGINSFQLAYDGTRWWVVSILWDEETPANPIPPEFAK